MSYIVKFDPTQKGDREAQSLKASMEYLGRARYLAKRRQLVDCFCNEPTMRVSTMYRRIRFVCAMLGMQGYWPARAMARHVLKVVVAYRARQQQTEVA